MKYTKRATRTRKARSGGSFTRGALPRNNTTRGSMTRGAVTRGAQNHFSTPAATGAQNYFSAPAPAVTAAAQNYLNNGTYMSAANSTPPNSPRAAEEMALGRYNSSGNPMTLREWRQERMRKMRQGLPM